MCLRPGAWRLRCRRCTSDGAWIFIHDQLFDGQPFRVLTVDILNGGAEEDRTPDLRIANATLSQLSYRPVSICPSPWWGADRAHILTSDFRNRYPLNGRREGFF